MTRANRALVMKQVAKARHSSLQALLLAEELDLDKPTVRRLRDDYNRLDATFSQLSTVHKTEALP